MRTILLFILCVAAFTAKAQSTQGKTDTGASVPEKNLAATQLKPGEVVTAAPKSAVNMISAKAAETEKHMTLTAIPYTDQTPVAKKSIQVNAKAGEKDSKMKTQSGTATKLK